MYVAAAQAMLWIVAAAVVLLAVVYACRLSFSAVL
jgi:hypothetical protein